MALTDLIKMDGVPSRSDGQQRFICSIKKDFTVREFVLAVVDLKKPYGEIRLVTRCNSYVCKYYGGTISENYIPSYYFDKVIGDVAASGNFSIINWTILLKEEL